MPYTPQYLLSDHCVTHSTVLAVTFLALGNGAPDISSSIAAVRAGQYKLALGSLLGIGTRTHRRLHQVSLHGMVIQAVFHPTFGVFQSLQHKQ